jgi:hypothetical protein
LLAAVAAGHHHDAKLVDFCEAFIGVKIGKIVSWNWKYIYVR